MTSCPTCGAAPDKGRWWVGTTDGKRGKWMDCPDPFHAEARQAAAVGDWWYPTTSGTDAKVNWMDEPPPLRQPLLEDDKAAAKGCMSALVGSATIAAVVIVLVEIL